MLSYGLERHLENLEDISGVASKEYALEKAMDKMKFEWEDVSFNFIPYRDTGLKIYLIYVYLKLVLGVVLDLTKPRLRSASYN